MKIVACLAIGWLAASPLWPAGSLQRVDELERELRSSDDDDRRKAVQALAKLGTEEAMDLLLGALEDPQPKVADEAQIQLGEVSDPELLELVLGKKGLGARDALVRERVAESLGGTALAFDSRTFEKALRDKDPGVRRALLWSMERIGVRGGFGDGAGAAAEMALRAFGSDKDPGVRAAALVAYGALEAPTDELLTEALADREAVCRCAAVLLAGELETDRALRFVPLGSEDEDVGVRTVAAELLAGIPDHRAALALVTQLEHEPSLRLRWRIVELLQAMSGKKHRLDPRPWRDWAGALPPDWGGADQKGAAPDHGEVSAAFAGLPILSQRVVFLIDLSGSVWEERSDGSTRKALIDEELSKALEGLGEDDRFNVIPYTSKPIPWKKELVQAKPANVAKALKWFEGRKDFGTGNFWDAAMLAMEDPEVDSIIVLTDGAPTGGHRWNLVLMKELFREHNRFRRLVLDAIIADRKGFLVEQWREMCGASGGRMIQVSFE